MSHEQGEKFPIEEIQALSPKIYYCNIKKYKHYEKVLTNLPQCSQIITRGEHVPDPDSTLSAFTNSGIDGKDKWTDSAISCMVTVLFGQTKDNNYLSLLTHMTPDTLSNMSSYDKYSNLVADFALRTLHHQSAILTGGNDDSMYAPGGYVSNARIFDRIHRKILGITTEALYPPKLKNYGFSDIYVSTAAKTLYVIGVGHENTSEPMRTITPDQLWQSPFKWPDR